MPKPPAPALLSHWLPLPVLTDSYKATHFLQYPPGTTKMVAYAEFRRGFAGDAADTRFAWFGARYAVENFVARRWTADDVDAAGRLFDTFLAPAGGRHPWPRELFMKVVTEHGGWLPVRVEALPEGTAAHARVPVLQITAEGEFAPLCTYLESVLTHCWYPATVATLSRRVRDVVAAAFEASADGGAGSPLLGSRLHDFGFRGCTCVEQAALGGAAHLLSFDGTDTLPAAYYATYALNGGRPVGGSIPATEHSVMTSWPSERGAVANMIARFGGGVYATVADSYDYARFLGELVPSVAAEAAAAGGFWVLRPDSGDPVEAVVAGLRAADAAFGAAVNSKGFRVPRGAGVIQGDGIDAAVVGRILDAVLAAGYSADAVAFGMGGGLLQRVDRDTMSFATKLCHVEVSGPGGAVAERRDVMKAPRGDALKASLPGVVAVARRGGVPTAVPAEELAETGEPNLLRVVYDCGRPLDFEWDDFDAVRARLAAEWAALPPRPPTASGLPLSERMLAKRDAAAAAVHAR